MDWGERMKLEVQRHERGAEECTTVSVDRARSEDVLKGMGPLPFE